MKYLKILLLIFLLFSFNSCGTIKEGFTNQKKNSSDEFLVEKKSPLVMPPDYSELPVPSSKKNINSLNDNKIKELLTNNNSNGDKSKNLDQDLEKSLIEKIKSN